MLCFQMHLYAWINPNLVVVWKALSISIKHKTRVKIGNGEDMKQC